ncbi:hypothetical protein AAMO2058_000343000 [Amorphochlora amoebiformis]
MEPPSPQKLLHGVIWVILSLKIAGVRGGGEVCQQVGVRVSGLKGCREGVILTVGGGSLRKGGGMGMTCGGERGLRARGNRTLGYKYSPSLTPFSPSISKYLPLLLTSLQNRRKYREITEKWPSNPQVFFLEKLNASGLPKMCSIYYYTQGGSKNTVNCKMNDLPLYLRVGVQSRNFGRSEAKGRPSEARIGPTEARSVPSQARSGPSEASSGPSEASSGSSEASSGPSESSSGPSEATSEPSEARIGPSEASNGPSEARSGPSEARSGPSEARFGPSEASDGPSEARSGPSEARSGPRGTEGGGGSLLEVGQDPMYFYIVPPAIQAATDVVLNFVATDMYTTIADYVSDTATAEIGLDISSYFAAQTVPKVVEDLKAWPSDMAEALTKKIVSSVQEKLTAEIARKSYNPVSRATVPPLADRISQDLSIGLSKVLSRALPIAVSTPLIQSLTHAVVSSVSQSLPVAKKGVYATACQDCFWSSLNCHRCPVSEENLYFHLYHSNYFSDYYAQYYASYYTESLIKADEALHKTAK